jgi:hypothetical protein
MADGGEVEVNSTTDEVIDLWWVKLKQ